MGNMDTGKVNNPSCPSQHRKRSSLKHNNLFPEGMSYEEYMLSKNRKLHWDVKAEEIEVIDEEDNTKMKDPCIKQVKRNSIKSVEEVNNHIKEIVEEETEIVKEIDVKFNEHNNSNFENKRRQSIKDEFSLCKVLLGAKIIDEEDEETDDADETNKNTQKNENID